MKPQICTFCGKELGVDPAFAREHMVGCEETAILAKARQAERHAEAEEILTRERYSTSLAEEEAGAECVVRSDDVVRVPSDGVGDGVHG